MEAAEDVHSPGKMEAVARKSLYSELNDILLLYFMLISNIIIR